jgi:hypothetical protein
MKRKIVAKWILSIDEIDHIREEGEDPTFSTFFDFEEGSELITTVPYSIWKAYDCPSNIVIEIIR